MLDRAYTSLVAVQKETRNDDANQADWFETCINSASRFIEHYCNTDFLLHDYSVTPYSVPPMEIANNILCLPYPVISIASVIEEGSNITSEVLYFRGGKMLTREANWAYAVNRITVQVYGTMGYQEVPFEIQRACTLIAANLTVQNRKEIINSDGGRDSVLQTKIPDEALTLLKQRRNLFL